MMNREVNLNAMQLRSRKQGAEEKHFRELGRKVRDFFHREHTDSA